MLMIVFECLLILFIISLSKCVHFIPRACGQQRLQNTSTQDLKDSPLEQTDVAAVLLATQEKQEMAVYVLFSLSYGNNRCCPLF